MGVRETFAPSDREPLRPKNTSKGKGKGKREDDFNYDPKTFKAVYPYVDEEGRLLFEVVRGEKKSDGTPKQFRQRRPDPANPVKRIWGLKDVRRVVYRLPQVLAAVKAGQMLVVCEGEKDVAALEGLGLVATCNSGGGSDGESSKWKPHHTEALKGAARVVVIADKDEPGRKHADKVAAALKPHAADVRVLELPGDLVKDAHDWVSAGGTAEQLQQLVDAAPVWQAPASPPVGPEAPSKEEPKGYRPLTDLGNAERLLDAHGEDLRFVPSGKKGGTWYHFDEGTGYWQAGCDHVVDQLANEVTRGIRDDIKKIVPLLADEDPADAEVRQRKEAQAILKWALKTEGGSKRREMISSAASLKSIVQPDRRIFDNVPDLLPVKNGVVELRTGKFRKARRDEYITRFAPVEYDPVAACPLWMGFLRVATMHDPDMVDYLQRIAGYCLTGVTKREIAWIFLGEPGSGKGTFLITIHRMLGALSVAMPEATIARKTDTKGGAPREDLERLRGGTRLSITFDTVRGFVPDMDFLKKAVSGEPIENRGLYGTQSDLNSQAKFLIAMNEPPKVRRSDTDFWRRFKMICFDNGLEEKDRDETLKARLLTELPGILNWALTGLKACWKEDDKFDFGECERVLDYTKKGPAAPLVEETTKALHDLFQMWWALHGTEPVTSLEALAMVLKNQHHPRFVRIAKMKDEASRLGALFRLLHELAKHGTQVGNFTVRFQTPDEVTAVQRKNKQYPAVLTRIEPPPKKPEPEKQARRTWNPGEPQEANA